MRADDVKLGSGSALSPSSPESRRAEPGKSRALEVRLVREVQVLNLKSLNGGVGEYPTTPSTQQEHRPTLVTPHLFRNACMKADQKHAVGAGRGLTEIRRTALADAIPRKRVLRWCKARASETLFR